MEEGIFLNEPTAGLLKDGYVEARLHTDGKRGVIPGELFDEINRVWRHFAKTPANPTFVRVDPDNEKALTQAAGFIGQEKFSAFLRGEDIQGDDG